MASDPWEYSRTQIFARSLWAWRSELQSNNYKHVHDIKKLINNSFNWDVYVKQTFSVAKTKMKIVSNSIQRN